MSMTRVCASYLFLPNHSMQQKSDLMKRRSQLITIITVHLLLSVAILELWSVSELKWYNFHLCDTLEWNRLVCPSNARCCVFS